MSEYTPPREVDDAPSLMQRHAENKNALAYLEEVIARKNERIAELKAKVERLENALQKIRDRKGMWTPDVAIARAALEEKGDE